MAPKHPRWVRISHWLNVPALALMVWSGILIYWANDAYAPFFPEWFYETFRIDHRLAEGMAIHFAAGWVFVLNSIFYLGGTLFTRHRREILPRGQTWREIGPTLLHDFRRWRGIAPAPGEKYNPAQRLAYTGAGLLLLTEVLTGFAIYKPVQLSWLLAPFGGYEGARLVHFVVMLALVAFTLVHVLQVIRAGAARFRAMVTGEEIPHEK